MGDVGRVSCSTARLMEMMVAIQGEAKQLRPWGLLQERRGQHRNLLNVVGHSTRIEHPIHSEAFIERVPEVWFPLNQEWPHRMGFLIDSVKKEK